MQNVYIRKVKALKKPKFDREYPTSVRVAVAQVHPARRVPSAERREKTPPRYVGSWWGWTALPALFRGVAGASVACLDVVRAWRAFGCEKQTRTVLQLCVLPLYVSVSLLSFGFVLWRKVDLLPMVAC